MTSTTGSERIRGALGTLALVAISVGMAGCGERDLSLGEEDRPGPVLTYICVETGAVEEGPPKPWPYLNPATGHASFVLHLYSEAAERWFPVPPAGPGQGNPLSTPCPKTGKPMSAVGPKPTKANVAVGRKVEEGAGKSPR